MKKVLFAMAVVATVCLASCGGNKESEQTANEAPAAVSTEETVESNAAAEETVATEEAPAEEAAATEAPAEEAAATEEAAN